MLVARRTAICALIPEATNEAGRTAGLVTTLGFAVAAALTTVP